MMSESIDNRLLSPVFAHFHYVIDSNSAQFHSGTLQDIYRSFHSVTKQQHLNFTVNTHSNFYCLYKIITGRIDMSLVKFNS